MIRAEIGWSVAKRTVVDSPTIRVVFAEGTESFSDFFANCLPLVLGIRLVQLFMQLLQLFVFVEGFPRANLFRLASKTFLGTHFLSVVAVNILRAKIRGRELLTRCTHGAPYCQVSLTSISCRISLLSSSLSASRISLRSCLMALTSSASMFLCRRSSWMRVWRGTQVKRAKEPSMHSNATRGPECTPAHHTTTAQQNNKTKKNCKTKKLPTDIPEGVPFSREASFFPPYQKFRGFSHTPEGDRHTTTDTIDDLNTLRFGA